MQSLGFPLILNCCLCSSKNSNRHSVWRTTDIVHLFPVAEFDRFRLSSMLSANTHLKIRTGTASSLYSNIHQFSNSLLVNYLEGVKLPMSSLEKPNPIWVRSFVPKEKNSASAAILSAVNAALGISIIVP